MYNIDIDEIIQANRVADATKIEVGQLIFIPRQKTPISPRVQTSLEDFIWPLKGNVIATFGENYNNLINKGLNIAPNSESEVVAARSGKVIFYSDDFNNYGKTIIIQHADDLSTVYARNFQVFVKAGDIVEKGTPIAKAGSTENDRNVYLHFEIRKGHTAKNPYFYLQN